MITGGRAGFAKLWLSFCVALTLLIFWLALMPVQSAPSGLGWDKLNHVAAIAAVTAITYLALHPHKRAAPAAFIYGVVLGILIELLQKYVTTTRSAEWIDLIADIIGAGAAWCAIHLYQRMAARQE